MGPYLNKNKIFFKIFEVGTCSEENFINKIFLNEIFKTKFIFILVEKMDKLDEFYTKYIKVFKINKNHKNETTTITTDNDMLIFNTETAAYKTSTY